MARSREERGQLFWAVIFGFVGVVVIMLGAYAMIYVLFRNMARLESDVDRLDSYEYRQVEEAEQLKPLYEETMTPVN